MPRRDSSPLSQQPHHPYLQGSKELVLWFPNFGRWPFMEEAGCQEANEDEKKKIFFCLLQSFIASPQGDSFLSLSLLTSCQSLVTFFHLWRVCWLHLESTGWTWIMESSPQFCFIPTKCPQSVKKVSVGLWSQELLGISWTWLCRVYFLPFLSPVMY